MTTLKLVAPAWVGVGDQAPGDVAKKFPIISGNFDSRRLDAFHAGGPTRLIKYQLGPYVAGAAAEKLNDGHPVGAGKKRYGKALAADANGNLIAPDNFPGNILAQPDSQEWRVFVADLVDGFFAKQPKWDGIISDSSGTAPTTSGYVSAPAINPGTGKAYTTQEWLDAVTVHLRAMKDALPQGKLLYINGLGSASTYWGRRTNGVGTRNLLLPGLLDGAMSESTWRGASADVGAWPNEKLWTDTVDMIEDVQSKGLDGMWWTKVWVDGLKPADSAAWRRFVVSSVLLASGPKTFMSFDDNHPDHDAAQWYPEYDVANRLGGVSGPRSIDKSGAHLRYFEGGLVAVNPTSKPITVTLPGTYRNFENTTVNRTLSLGPSSGEALVS